eukprot:CAMPEP_0180543048 /NCGR_PEP_ID=MMETSP1036_2-20121128/68774_1 /TAXON_ID=632150 /ORGANISM="Azadinium spinosum, Strain 3D9" /LENGTH=31 /DNA_ID= /DNA_START= /DNA_END= /DNA_ORIENTATION=
MATGRREPCCEGSPDFVGAGEKDVMEALLGA